MLKTGYYRCLGNPLIFNDDTAIEQLGVGKNMVRSIRFWCVLFRLLEDADGPGRQPTEFGKKLLDNATGWDPYLEDPASLCLLLWQIFRPPFMAVAKIWKKSVIESGLLIIGGGTPKNFIQDVVICAEVLGKDVPMHKYAVQITVADSRDGACSSSTLKEARSWGKVDAGNEQMVFCEGTIAVLILASYAYHRGHWKERTRRNLRRPVFRLI